MHGLWNIWPHGNWRNMEAASISSKHRSQTLGNEISDQKKGNQYQFQVYGVGRGDEYDDISQVAAYQCLNIRILHSKAYVLTRYLWR
jgi:hypothetical protein